MATLDIPKIRETSIARFSPFLTALDKIESVFSQLGTADGDGIVFVDLFPHGSLSYHISNLLIARYISIHTGRRMVGLTVKDPLFIRSAWDAATILPLASAFGVKDVRFLDEALTSDGPNTPTPRTENAAAFADEVERDAAGTRYYGFEDRIRRRYLIPSLDKVTVPPEWLEAERDQLTLFRANIEKLNIQPSDLFLCGHLEYDPYKITALNMVRRGASVIYNWALQPFTLKKFSTEHDLLNLKMDEAKDAFDSEYQRLSGQPESFDALAKLYRAGLRRVRPTIIGDKTSGDVGQANKKGVVIMTQALSDGVHSYGPMLFDDFADWISESLKAITTAKNDVCLRDHPMQGLYDQSNHVDALKAEYANNLCFSVSPGEDVLDTSLYQTAVTTQGTPGIELPLDYVRTVIAGQARYSGYGFVDEPQSREEYFKLITDQTPLPEAELRERFQRAALFGYMEIFSFRSSCRFLPFGLKGQPTEILDQLSAITSIEAIFADPLFAQVGKIVSGKANITFDPSRMPVFDGQAASFLSQDVFIPATPEAGRNVAPTATAPIAASRGDVADQGRPVPAIVADLIAAKGQQADLDYATAVYRAFWNAAPEQSWLLGAFKCLGRPWGRSRIVRHAFNQWVQENRSDLTWPEFRRHF